MLLELPEDIKDLEAALREQIKQEIGPTCVLNKCKFRVLKRESDGDIQVRYSHYCGRRGHLTPL